MELISIVLMLYLPQSWQRRDHQMGGKADGGGFRGAHISGRQPMRAEEKGNLRNEESSEKCGRGRGGIRRNG